MNDRINVLNINIDNYTAKEAMKCAVSLFGSEAVSVIDFVTADSAMEMSDISALKQEMESFDLVLAGEKMILEAAGITDKKIISEVENRVFIKMLLRYLHKHMKRIYILVESEGEAEELYQYLGEHYKGIEICGMAKVSAANRADMMIVNAINGNESDCVLSMLSSPLQEDFIVSNRKLMNTRMWLGVRKNIFPIEQEKFGQGKIAQFIMGKLLKKEMKKQYEN